MWKCVTCLGLIISMSVIFSCLNTTFDNKFYFLLKKLWNAFHTRPVRDPEENRRSVGVGDADAHHSDKVGRSLKSEWTHEGWTRFTDNGSSIPIVYIWVLFLWTEQQVWNTLKSGFYFSTKYHIWIQNIRLKLNIYEGPKYCYNIFIIIAFIKSFTVTYFAV